MATLYTMNSNDSANNSTPAPAFFDISFLFQPQPDIAVQFYKVGLSLSFLLGFVGNTLSLLTFSRVALRTVSTGCLFLCLAISDTFFLIICVISFVEFGLQQPIAPGYYAQMCRFRAFIQTTAQLLSAWILVLISFDRWFRTRFPFKAVVWCTPKKALLLVAVLLVICIGLNSHQLSTSFGEFVPGIPYICSASVTSIAYFLFYYNEWGIIVVSGGTVVLITRSLSTSIGYSRLF